AAHESATRPGRVRAGTTDPGRPGRLATGIGPLIHITEIVITWSSLTTGLQSTL
ncbi:hypothetical protein JYU34_002558, partial [Plutella xylostella]